MTETFSTGQLISFSEQRGTLRYKLAPYGEKARDRDATFSTGSINFSNAEGAIVNVEHDKFRPIGKLSNFESTSEGLFCTVTLADTTLGRDTFTEAKEGLRTGISMELSEMSPATGLITSATLSGAGICVNPALGSARLIQAFSEDEEIRAALEEIKTSIDAIDAALEPTSEAEAEEDSEEESPLTTPEESSEEENPNGFNMNENAVPAPTQPAVTLSYESLAEARKDARVREALIDTGLAGETNAFALSPVTHTGHTSKIEQAAFLGELWSGARYQRRFAPLVSTGVLTSWKVEGFKFVGDFLVDTYAGDLAEIPSNAVTTVAYSEEALRCAHGVKVDRKFRDFGNAEFLRSLFEKQTEGYAKLSDKRVLDRIKAMATNTTAKAYVAGVAPGFSRILDGALAVLATTNELPTFAILSADLHREMALTTEFDNLKFLTTSLGLADGSMDGMQIVVANDLPANTVYVGHKNALQFFEFGSIIRVEAEDVSHGGFDEAVFGYTAFVEHEKKAIVKVLPPTP
ncbi:hypothetical protein PSET11_03038 [Arthrobacter ulcerisalmonis]|uniref:Caudovirus prohead protease n=1 Tax=Arthrobacter ulcerisalmonis TaxID=2483813 RepID=A0A3P5XBT5_9MICC|nr:hypothetical protein [Arthrobacter ulcerisalmonis]VDC32275.1 hypothetical protein PSET11_03038 [Arthrobacter ulcerisalmonis]